MSEAYNNDRKVLIEEQQASGINMNQFCKEKGLPHQTFKYHKYRLQSQSSIKSPFLPVNSEVPKELELTLSVVSPSVVAGIVFNKYISETPFY